MNNYASAKLTALNRRQTMLALGGAGASLLFVGGSARTPAQAQTVFDCILSPQMTEGPYWVDERLNRSDIRADPSNGSVKPGTPLTLSIAVHSITSSTCSPLPRAHVDIWHCDAGGLYSGVSANNTTGQMFLRGYQITDDNGEVNFTTIYPGWYSGRTVHIHLRVRTFSGSQVVGNYVSQLFFDDAVTDEVFAASPYSARPNRNTRNANDNIYSGQTRTLLNLTKTASGYAASINVGVNLEAVGALAPSINANGVVNAASFEPGVAPQGFTAIFGQNLAASTRVVTASDLVDGYLPTSLGGVSARINNKAAFMHYVSPTQVNLQAPDDTNVGAVDITVTNSSGTSTVAAANMQTVLPGFFTLGDYAAAVKLDGAIVTGVVGGAEGTTPAAAPGEVLLLFGSGFGPTDPAVAAGLVFEGAYPLASELKITIGGVEATVLFGGLAAAALYQFNITVPGLPNGNHEVIAEIAGLSSPAGVFLKIQS